MTAGLFVLTALVVGAVGLTVGIIVAPVLTRASDRMAGVDRGEAAGGDDDED